MMTNMDYEIRYGKELSMRGVRRFNPIPILPPYVYNDLLTAIGRWAVAQLPEVDDRVWIYLASGEVLEDFVAMLGELYGEVVEVMTRTGYRLTRASYGVLWKYPYDDLRRIS